MSTGDAFLKLFSRSPIGPMQAHMQEANQCAQLLPSSSQQPISRTDSSHLPSRGHKHLRRKSRPVENRLTVTSASETAIAYPRMDLLQLISTQDKIANLTKDISGIMIVGQVYQGNQVTLITISKTPVPQANKQNAPLTTWMCFGIWL